MKQFIAKLFGLHTERDLVSFGNYLIAHRATAITMEAIKMEAIQHKLTLDKIHTHAKPVQHADLCNWAFEQSHGITI